MKLLGLWVALLATACSTSDDLAAGVAIANVDLYQGPRIPLVRDGEVVTTRDAPVIARRPARVVVAAVVRPGAEPRDVLARLIFDDRVTGERRTIEGPGTIAAGASVLEIGVDVPAAALRENLSLGVEIVEAGPFDSRLDVEDAARQPVIPVDARVSRTFRIVVRAAGDPVPELTDEQLSGWRAALYAWLPVESVELTRGPDMTFPRPLQDDDDFQALLGQLAAWRAESGIDPDVFAYAAVRVPPFAKIGGMAANLSVSPAYWRVAAGDLANNPEIEITTLVHEIGHLLGRSHVACGEPGGPDHSYPYADGSIGVPGIDFRDHTMRMPSEYRDVMSYCLPAFVSDYGFGAAFRGLSQIGERSADLGEDREPAFIADPVWWDTTGALP